MKIRWNTDVNVPGCPGKICAVGRFRKDERPEPIFIQTDWDFPGTARSFGWRVDLVQRCPECGAALIITKNSANNRRIGRNCWCSDALVNKASRINFYCAHKTTDGTVDCKDCTVRAGDFISAAGDWLRDHNGATAEDPGYF